MAQQEHTRLNPLTGETGSAAPAAISCLICTQRVDAGAMERHMERKHLNYKRHACQECEFSAFDWRAIGMHAEQMGHRALLNSNMNAYTERLVKKLRRDCVKAARGKALSESTISSTLSNSSTSASLPSCNPDEQTGEMMVAMKEEPMSRGSTPVPDRESSAHVGRAPPKGKGSGQAGGARVAKKKKASERKSLTCIFPDCGAKVPVNGTMVLPAKRRHIETAHLPPAVAMLCPVEGCTSTQNNLNGLSSHIGVVHKGVENLSDEERAVYKELRQEVNTAVNSLLPQCFSDAAAASTAAEEGMAAPPTRRRRSARKNGRTAAMETASPTVDEQQ